MVRALHEAGFQKDVMMLFRARKFAAVTVAALSLAVVSVGHGDAKPAITKPGYDPSARKVEMFQAIKDGLIDVKLIQMNAKNGNLVIDNKGKEPLTIQLPDAFVGVNVLNQGGFGGGGLGGGGLGGGGLGGGQGGQQGGGQTTGGGAGGGLGGGLGGGGLGGGGLGGGGAGGGGGFFSIPAEKRVRLPVRSVCLEYGKPEPNSKSPYQVREVESFSKDPVLKEMLGYVSAGRASENVAQAAGWHLSNGKSWAELAALKVDHIGAAPTMMFTQQEISQAQLLIAASKQRAVDKEEARKKSGTKETEKTESLPTASTRARP